MKEPCLGMKKWGWFGVMFRGFFVYLWEQNSRIYEKE